MADKIYFDDIYGDKSVASTSSETLVFKNLIVFEKYIQKNNSKSIYAVPMGKYIGVHLRDRDKQTMLFFDCKNNKAHLNAVLKMAPTYMHEAVISAFDFINRNYEDCFAEVELVLRKPFPSISEN